MPVAAAVRSIRDPRLDQRFSTSFELVTPIERKLVWNCIMTKQRRSRQITTKFVVNCRMRNFLQKRPQPWGSLYTVPVCALAGRYRCCRCWTPIDWSLVLLRNNVGFTRIISTRMVAKSLLLLSTRLFRKSELSCISLSFSSDFSCLADFTNGYWLRDIFVSVTWHSHFTHTIFKVIPTIGA